MTKGAEGVYNCIYNMADMDRKKMVETVKGVADECIAFRVRFASRVITNLYDRALHHLDIKINQVSILVFLTVNGGSGPGDIVRGLRMDKSTVSRNIERMRKKGWIEIGAGHDGVRQTITVTEKGVGLLAKVHVEWMKAQESARAVLGEEGVRAAQTLFEAVKPVPSDLHKEVQDVCKTDSL